MLLSFTSSFSPLPSQVNSQNIEEMTHKEAAACLKGAGTVVTLVVEYQPNEYKEFQQKLQKIQVARAPVRFLNHCCPNGCKSHIVGGIY